MKKVINGKMYNTETAIKIGQDNNPHNQGDFEFENTKLYKTAKGAFFLAGEGGPMSRWAESCGNGMMGGSGIQALTAAEALEWCETNEVDADTITAHFKIDEA